MRLKEQRLWDRMRNRCPASVRLERVENMLDEGFPDVLAKAEAAQAVFCELKAVHALPRRATTRVFGDEGLTVGQRNWLLDWAKFDGRALIVASALSGAAAVHWALPGVLADAFNDLTAEQLGRMSVTRHQRGTAFWDALYTHIKGQK